VKHAFIEKHRRQYGVPALCEALQISPSGYYAARHRGPSERRKRQTDLTARIRTIHQASRESYGAPRVHAELLAQKVPCCRNTVAKLMRRAEILPKAIRRFRVTTDSRRTQASPNLIHRDFRSRHPNDLWLSDITYIPTREGWLYLAAVLDTYSRALVGWSMSRNLDTRLAMNALNMAIAHRGPPVTLHSDQGSTYATGSYREIVNRYGIRQSMSRKGDCWDNAPMEASSIPSKPSGSCTATTRHAMTRALVCSTTSKCSTTGSDGTHRLTTRPRYRMRRLARLGRCPPFAGRTSQRPLAPGTGWQLCVHTGPAAYTSFAQLSRARRQRLCQGSETCLPTCCDLVAIARLAGSWCGDRSALAWFGEWNASRTRWNRDRFPGSSRTRSWRTVESPGGGCVYPTREEEAVRL
jgi:transposase InsO family protein